MQQDNRQLVLQIVMFLVTFAVAFFATKYFLSK